MNVKSKNKIVFGILGLPRSGTTLLNNIFNTYKNSFCISEPHWANILNPGSIKLDKIDIDCRNNSEIYPNIKNLIDTNNNFIMGGVKETFRHHQVESANYIINSSNVDLIIGIFRDPVSGFNGWLRTAWKGYYISPQNYVTTYMSFFNTLSNIKNKKVVMLKYEDVCDGGIDYINSKLQNIVELSPINEVKKTNYVFGDPSANLGGKINTPNINNGNIDVNVRDFINNHLSKIYTTI